MTKTEFLEHVAAIRQEVALRFDSTNPHFKNKYLSLNGTLEALQPFLSASRLLLTQAPVVTPGGFVIQTVVQSIDAQCDADGEETGGANVISGEWPIEAKGRPQEIAAASTYARRYSILCLFGLCATDDDAEVTESRGAAGLLSKI